MSFGLPPRASPPLASLRAECTAFRACPPDVDAAEVQTRPTSLSQTARPGLEPDRLCNAHSRRKIHCSSPDKMAAHAEVGRLPLHTNSVMPPISAEVPPHTMPRPACQAATSSKPSPFLDRSKAAQPRPRPPPPPPPPHTRTHTCAAIVCWSAPVVGYHGSPR